VGKILRCKRDYFYTKPQAAKVSTENWLKNKGTATDRTRRSHKSTRGRITGRTSEKGEKKSQKKERGGLKGGGGGGSGIPTSDARRKKKKNQKKGGGVVVGKRVTVGLKTRNVEKERSRFKRKDGKRSWGTLVSGCKLALRVGSICKGKLSKTKKGEK